MTRRKPFLRRVSSVKAKLNREYKTLRDKFLAENPWCQACRLYGFVRCPSGEIHHLRGRTRKLQNDVRFWRALCRRCHVLVNQDPALARHLGLLCELGKWMVSEPL